MANLKRHPSTVNCYALLAMYIVIPLTIVIVCLDHFLLNKWLLKEYLPVHPYEWAWYLVIFGMPHIVGSVITLVDDEYINYYKKKLTCIFLIIITSMVVITRVFGVTTLVLIMSAHTIYHAIAQQTGLCFMMLKQRPTKSCLAWKQISIILAILVFFTIFIRSGLNQVSLFGQSLLHIVYKFEGFLLLLSVLFAIKVHSQSSSKVGILYLWGNVLLVAWAYICALLQYDVFVILIPRIIHDITAFIVYGVHDQNRNREANHNYIYKAFSWTKVPPWLLSPILAVSISYFLFRGKDAMEIENVAIVYTIYFINFFHYLIESFVWKKENIHRLCVPFTFRPLRLTKGLSSSSF